jgi:hypothetical protein
MTTGDAAVVVVVEAGAVRFVYDDTLVELLEAGDATVRRASHVEPTADGRWSADLSPVGGPELGPFRLRREALDAEVAWLRRHLLGAE